MVIDVSQYTIILEPSADGYGAHSPDVPGCVAVGDTREECLLLMQEALKEHVEMLIELGKPVPEPVSTRMAA